MNASGYLSRIAGVLCLSLLWAEPSWGMDSYRYLHVSIDTPWYIFIFLLTIFFAPFLLMAILVWRYAERKKEHKSTASGEQK